jgi:hypothetical protein
MVTNESFAPVASWRAETALESRVSAPSDSWMGIGASLEHQQHESEVGRARSEGGVTRTHCCANRGRRTFRALLGDSTANRAVHRDGPARCTLQIGDHGLVLATSCSMATEVRNLTIPIDGIELEGSLAIPTRAHAKEAS